MLAKRNVDTLNAENVKSIDKDIPTLVQKTDVASEAEVRELYERINEKFGRADVVVNNAVTGGYGSIGEIDPGIDSCTSTVAASMSSCCDVLIIVRTQMSILLMQIAEICQAQGLART